MDLKLIPYKHIPKSELWEPGDTQELYERNLTLHPEDWYWRDKPFTYTWNSQGYRAPEWVDVDWASSVVFMGCSFVAGIGVSDEQTVSAQYTALTNIPSVNLGMGGAGCHVVNWNTLCLLSSNIKPRAVVIIAPDPARLTYFNGTHVHNMLPSIQPELPQLVSMYNTWLEARPNAEYHGIMAIKGAEAMWRAQGVPVVLAHRSEVGAYFDINTQYILSQRIDRARDEDARYPGSGHNGPKTYLNWAKQIASWLPI